MGLVAYPILVRNGNPHLSALFRNADPRPFALQFFHALSDDRPTGVT